MSQYAGMAVLKVVSVDQDSATYTVKCVEGLLTLGDLVAVDDDLSVATEDESIQLFQNVYVDELEPNFGALLICADQCRHYSGLIPGS